MAVINVILYKELNYVMSKTKTYCTNKVVLRIDYNCDNKIKISIVGQMFRSDVLCGNIGLETQ